MIIRKSLDKDYPRLSEILKNGLKNPPYKEDWSIVEAKKRLQHIKKNGDIFVSILDNKIAGFISFIIIPSNNGDIVHIEYLFVDCMIIGKGIGSGLLERLESYVKNKKIKSIIVKVDPKALAYNFYTKKGYIEKVESKTLIKHLQ